MMEHPAFTLGFSTAEKRRTLTPEERLAINLAIDAEIEDLLAREGIMPHGAVERPAPAGWDTLENVR